MKGREHLGIAVFIALIISITLGYYEFNIYPFLLLESRQLHWQSVFSMVGGFYFFCMGSIFPDVDSEDRNSYIFHTYLRYITIPFVPFAYLGHFLEYPIAKILKRRRKHRGSTHTIVGILLMTLFIMGPLAGFFIWFDFFNIHSFMFVSICFLLGQLLHVLQDWHFELI